MTAIANKVILISGLECVREIDPFARHIQGGLQRIMVDILGLQLSARNLNLIYRKLLKLE